MGHAHEAHRSLPIPCMAPVGQKWPRIVLDLQVGLPGSMRYVCECPVDSSCCSMEAELSEEPSMAI